MRIATTLATVGLLLLVQGCGGTLGGTRPFVLDLEGASVGMPGRAVAVSSVSVLEDANEVDSVGTYHLGKMGDSEIADLRKSLADTLARVDRGGTAAAPLGVHLIVSHYYVAHSNSDGGILAAVDWALVDGTTDVVFSEQFFASAKADDVEGLNTLGKLKDLLNAQIVRRVAEKSVRLAADAEREPVVAVAHTYATAAEAAEPLPKRLTSFMGLPSFSTKGVDWTAGAPTTAVDWATRLEAR